MTFQHLEIISRINAFQERSSETTKYARTHVGEKKMTNKLNIDMENMSSLCKKNKITIESVRVEKIRKIK
jgi:hypothetical protein